MGHRESHYCWKNSTKRLAQWRVDRLFQVSRSTNFQFVIAVSAKRNKINAMKGGTLVYSVWLGMCKLTIKIELLM